MADNFEVDEILPELGCTRADFYAMLGTLIPKADLVNSDSLQVLSDKITAGDRLPFWRKYTVGFAALQLASLNNNVELFQLPAGGVLHAVKVKHSTAFAGTAITDVKLAVGLSLTLGKFVDVFDVDSAVSATNLRIAWAPFWASLIPAAFVNTDNAIGGLTISGAYSQAEVTALRNACETLADDSRALRTAMAALFAGGIGSESQTAAVSIRLGATAVGANLSALNAGSVDVWALWSLEV